jgi:hypothetical protein
MSVEIRGQEYTAKIRMILEDNAEEIVRFAFMPVRCPPDACDGGDLWIILAHAHLKPQPVIVLGLKKMIVDDKSIFLFRSAVCSAQIGKQVEFVLLFQKATSIQN